MPRHNPEDNNLGGIQTDLEFLIERVSKLPTRQEFALRPLYIIAGSAGLVIAWICLFRRDCLYAQRPPRRLLAEVAPMAERNISAAAMAAFP